MNQKIFVCASSWARSGVFQEAGLGVYQMDPETGALTLIQRVDTDISFNVTHIDGRRGVLYALNETDKLPEMRSGGGGRVFVYRVDPDAGTLTQIGCTPTWCPNPSYITLDATGSYAIVANHGSSAAATKLVRDAYGKFTMKLEHDDSVVELFEVREDGTLGELLDADWHYGSGPERRQLIARPHSAVMSPDGTLFAVCDKGNDTVSMYTIDRQARKLKLCPEVLHRPPASLPRYCVFHPTLPFFYHNNENHMDLCAYRYDQEGRLRPIDAYSVLPEGDTPAKGVLEQQGLVIHPNGRYIYDIVRGPNVISIFEVNEADGTLRRIQSRSVNDTWPRGCAITGDGRFLIVCGVDGGKLFVYEIGSDGRLKDSCKEYDQPLSAYALTWTQGE